MTHHVYDVVLGIGLMGVVELPLTVSLTDAQHQEVNADPDSTVLNTLVDLFVTTAMRDLIGHSYQSSGMWVKSIAYRGPR